MVSRDSRKSKGAPTGTTEGVEARPQPSREEEAEFYEDLNTPARPKLNDGILANTRNQVDLLAHMICNLEPEYLEELIQGYSRQVGVGVFFDPTGWIENHRAWQGSEEILRAIAECRAKIIEVRERAERGR